MHISHTHSKCKWTICCQDKARKQVYKYRSMDPCFVMKKKRLSGIGEFKK